MGETAEGINKQELQKWTFGKCCTFYTTFCLLGTMTTNHVVDLCRGCHFMTNLRRKLQEQQHRFLEVRYKRLQQFLVNILSWGQHHTNPGNFNLATPSNTVVTGSLPPYQFWRQLMHQDSRIENTSGQGAARGTRPLGEGRKTPCLWMSATVI